jgi:predicted nuclease of predicted toxin-antitoxin system
VKRLLLDQGVPRDAAFILRSLGWDVIHVGEIGLAAAEDRQIIARAVEEGRVCVTLDLDFSRSTGAQRRRASIGDPRPGWRM